MSKLREDPGEEQTAPRDQEQSVLKKEDVLVLKKEEKDHNSLLCTGRVLRTKPRYFCSELFAESNHATHTDIVYNEDVIDRWALVRHFEFFRHAQLVSKMICDRNIVQYPRHCQISPVLNKI